VDKALSVIAFLVNADSVNSVTHRYLHQDEGITMRYPNVYSEAGGMFA